MPSDLKWLARFNPDCVRVGKVRLFWHRAPVDYLLIEGPVQQAAGRHFIPVDLVDVMVAIDENPEARQFFLDLACWLLLRCVEGEFGGLQGPGKAS
jgi:hypothetical protein